MSDEFDSDEMADALDALERSAARFGSAISDALKGASVEGRAFDDVLRTLGQRLAGMALDTALKPLENAFGGLLSGLTGALAGTLGSALSGSGQGPAPTLAPSPVTVNVHTPNAPSFQRSAGQISAVVARSTARGRRSL